MQDFQSLDLSLSLLKALEVKGYKYPTPIQAQSIPVVLKGMDLLGIAQTGTGKTAAFSLPMIDLLSRSKRKAAYNSVRSLVMTPTRELASQIQLNIQDYARGTSLSSTVIFGGVGQIPQVRAISRGVDILIATPGRLLDLINQKKVNFDQLEMLVLDEADRMLDMGFINDIRKILAKLPREKQTLLFSATMPTDIERLASSLLRNPVRVEVTPQATTVEKIDQSVNMLDRKSKPLRLTQILDDHSIQSVLVFTRTKRGANKVVEHLESQSILASAIHGNKSQNAREKALGSFRAGKIRVLVATDIAARGIDVSQVGHVINYDLPDDPMSYVHRIGRTARAGRSGQAISFCDGSEMKLLRSIEKLIKIKVPVDSNHPFHCVPVETERTHAKQYPSKNFRKKRSGYKSFKR